MKRKFSPDDFKYPDRPFFFHDFDGYLEIIKNWKARGGLSWDSSHEKPSQAWCNNTPYEKAERLAIEGWPEGVEAAKKVVARLTKSFTTESFQQDVVMGIEGSQPDFGAYYSGRPECMLSLVDDAPSQKKHIVIEVDTAASYAISAETYMRRGVYIIALVEILKIAGYSPEIIMSAHHKEYSFVVDLRGAGVQGDTDRLAYFLGHIAAFRRLSFAYREAQDTKTRKLFQVNGAYGRPDSKQHYKAADIRFNAMQAADGPQWDSEEKAIKYIAQELKKQGVEICVE